MQPNVLDGDIVQIAPVAEANLRRGDIALTRSGGRFLLHRVVRRDSASGRVITRGDAGLELDQPAEAVLGTVVSIERGGKAVAMGGRRTILAHSARRHSRRLAGAIYRRARRCRPLFLPILFLVSGIFLHAGVARGQFTIGDSASPAAVAPGATITYTQVLTATARFTPSARNPATTSQTIPANTTYVGYSVTGRASGNWTCTLTAGVLNCSDPYGATRYFPGNTTNFTITVTVSATATNGTVITDTVNSSPGGGSATATATVELPDLSMTQTEAPNPVATGANITYTETVSNLSAVTASGATLTQSTPANTVFASATAPAGWTCGTTPAVGATGSIVCTATGSLAASSTSGNFAIVVTVMAAAPVGSTITNTATVTETGTDPNPGNNTTTTTTTV
ncbi:MAG TPA: hypothetical protein VNK23_11170, partial [Candidatus Dormibacteraeota bacterium]|nr:hypothetical protein [Candidatus Dormibacteraeota bacterium]